MSGGQQAAWLLLGIGSGVLMASAWSHWLKGQNWPIFLGVGISLLVAAAGAFVFRGFRRDKD